MDSGKDPIPDPKQHPTTMVKMKAEESFDDDVQPLASKNFVPDQKVKVEPDSEFTPLVFAPQPAPTDEKAPKPKGKKRQLTGDKCAKDYWRRQFSSAYQHEANEANGANETNDTTSDELATAHHAKRQRLAFSLTRLEEENDLFANGTAQEGTIEARAKLGNVAMQAVISGGLRKAKQLKILWDDLDHNDPQAVRDHHLLTEAAMSFGYGRCKAQDGKWTLPHFKTSLYHHQLIGVRWMLGREYSPHGPNGGILTDEMGLGKTVQILACMSQNRPEKGRKKGSVGADGLKRQTLIIAPESLQRQWYDEVERHCSDTRITVWKAKYGALSDVTLSNLDIIITNYHQVQAQWRKPTKSDLREIEELREKNDDRWKDKVRQLGGFLFKIDWYRIVCDEGHAMNNRNSKTSRACRYLIGQYRWVLTGTPMTNNTNEFFPYLDFLGTRFSQFKTYQEDMGNLKDENHLENLRAAYRGLTLRRGVGDTFMGKPILQIPKTHPIKVVTVELSPLERKGYAALKNELDELVDEVKEAKKKKMIIPGARERIVKLWGYLRFYIAHPSHVNYNYHAEYTNEIQTEGLTAATVVSRQLFCRLCLNVLADPFVPECGHALCGNCVNGGVKYCPSCKRGISKLKPGGDECFDQVRYCKFNRPRKPGQDELGMKPRMTGRKPRKKLPMEEAQANTTTKGKRVVKKKPAAKGKAAKSKKKQGKGKAARAKEPKEPRERISTHLNAEMFLKTCDSQPWAPIPHSSKTRATLELIQEWQAEAPNDKIIGKYILCSERKLMLTIMVVFAQWVPMLAILGRMVFQQGLRFVYYWGGMQTQKKSHSIKAFREDPEIKVMLMSVQCGALGLNLTAANRAIVVDHWWHKCMENQAFGRIHRIGQEKEVYTAKIVVNDTIDDKIMALQINKELDIAAATGKEARSKKMTLSQMHHLLRGVELADEDLNDFIIEDNEDYDPDNSYNEDGSEASEYSSDNDNPSDTEYKTSSEDDEEGGDEEGGDEEGGDEEGGDEEGGDEEGDDE
ncbi:SNF2 family N-terminal domain-containing protein [Cladorrhinum sp. PSN259]|nr:SNF2 family N-terminal domain-containing protein [Cladorrhinum sp. PSN259]